MSKSLADLFGKEEKTIKPKKQKKKVSKPKAYTKPSYEPNLLNEINQKLTNLLNILNRKNEDLEYKLIQIIKENDPTGWRLKQIISIIRGFYPEVTQGEIKNLVARLEEEGKIYKDTNYYFHVRDSS